MTDVASKIKEYRRKKFLTQREFAKLLGVSVLSVNRWENSKFEPTLQIQKKLYQLFLDAGMNVDN